MVLSFPRPRYKPDNRRPEAMAADYYLTGSLMEANSIPLGSGTSITADG